MYSGYYRLSRFSRSSDCHETGSPQVASMKVLDNDLRQRAIGRSCEGFFQARIFIQRICSAERQQVETTALQNPSPAWLRVLMDSKAS